MKKLVLLAVLGAVLTAMVFGQALDFPAWLREGMSLSEIKKELKGISLVNDGFYYGYIQNGIYHTFLVPNDDWGLVTYTIEAKNVDINKLISDFSKKYSLPQPEYKYSYYNWDLKEISKKNKMPLYTNRQIYSIQISQKKDSVISLTIDFNWYEYEKAIDEFFDDIMGDKDRKVLKVEDEDLTKYFEEAYDGSLGENVTITGQVYNLNNEIEAKLNIPVFVMEEGDNGKMDLELFRGSITNGKLSISLKGNLKKLWSLTKYNININEYDISNVNAKITILHVSVDPKNGELVLIKSIDDNRYSYVYYVYSDSDVTIKSKKTIKSVIDGYNYETDVDVRLKKGWNCFTERITNVSNNERKLYQRTEKLDSNYRWYLVKE